MIITLYGLPPPKKEYCLIWQKMIKLRILRRVYPRLSRWIQCNHMYPCKRSRGTFDTYMKKTMWRRRQIGVMDLSTKEHQGLCRGHQKLRKTRNGFFSLSLQREHSLADTLILDLRPPELWAIYFCCFTPPSLWKLITEVLGN